jgi:hypothetical protein
MWALIATFEKQAMTSAVNGTDSSTAALLRYVEQVMIDEFFTTPVETGGYLGSGATTAPYNPQLTQWGMHVMRFPKAWDKIRGHAYVGVVDNGIDPTHPDLIANFRPHFARNLRGSDRSNVTETSS